NVSPYVKDAFHDFVIRGDAAVVNPEASGTKAAPHYRLRLASGEAQTIRLRLYSDGGVPEGMATEQFDQVFANRIRETDEFYADVSPGVLTPEKRTIVRQGYAGLIWSKQFYHYVVDDWLEGDPNTPPPPAQRLRGRNWEWTHLHSRDIFSMPDKWEY